jgi:hypothetical protein
MQLQFSAWLQHSPGNWRNTFITFASEQNKRFFKNWTLKWLLLCQSLLNAYQQGCSDLYLKNATGIVLI